MSKARESIKYGVMFGLGWFLAGAAIGGGLDLHNHSESDEQLFGAEADLSAAESTIVTVDDKLYNLKLTLGEACVSTLQPYTVEQPLENVPEDEVLSDLLANEQKPCGNDPTKVRGYIRSYRSDVAELQTANALLDTLPGQIEAYQVTDTDDANFNGALVVGGLLGALGALYGVKSDPETHFYWV